MRIVEIIPQLHMGGAESFTVNLANELSALGHEIILICTNSVEKYGYFSQFLSPKVKLISMDKRKGPDPMLFLRLPKLVKSLNPDIVHTHLGAILYNLLTPYICKKAKFFHTIHNSADKEAITGGRISAWSRKFLFRRNKVIPVTISKESKKSFLKYYGNISNPKMIFNGIPFMNINQENATEISSESSLKLVNVARVMPQKNQMALVEAVEAINNEKIPVELYLIGYNDTPEGDAIRAMRTKHTHLLGPKDNPRDYMAASDAFILSSIYEGMPLTLIESMSVAKPAICTPVGGIIDMIDDGKNGVLATGTSMSEIKNAINRFANLSEQEREMMGKEALKEFSKYTMRNCANNYLKLFKS